MSLSSSELTALRLDFPLLSQKVAGHALVYFDNAATTPKPQVVIDAVRDFYMHDAAAVHRGAHALSARATQLFENVRTDVAAFLNAPSANNIVFVRGTTEGINLVAHSFALERLSPGDEIIVSAQEHHANFVPWQVVCKARQAHLNVLPLDETGQIKLEDLRAALARPNVKLLAVTHVSNVLGMHNEINEWIRLAHAQGVPVLVDGAQAVAHGRVDVTALDCDFYLFSGHKLFAPSGVGVLYGKAAHLAAMPPYQTGGHMVRSVEVTQTTYQDPPYRFEAGTPAMEATVGLGAAIHYLKQLDIERLVAHERALCDYFFSECVRQIPELHLLGSGNEFGRIPLFSFNLGAIHAHDVGTVLDSLGIAVRTGHHCCFPLMAHFGCAASVRASLAFYNQEEELSHLIKALKRAMALFGQVES